MGQGFYFCSLCPYLGPLSGNLFGWSESLEALELFTWDPDCDSLFYLGVLILIAYSAPALIKPYSQGSIHQNLPSKPGPSQCLPSAQA